MAPLNEMCPTDCAVWELVEFRDRQVVVGGEWQTTEDFELEATSVSGTLTVLSISGGRVTGNFSATVRDRTNPGRTVTLTNGTFNVPIVPMSDD